jgi:hypothetical protein
MKQTNTVMLTIFAALGVMLVAALIGIPAIHEANAKGMPQKTHQLVGKDNEATGKTIKNSIVGKDNDATG